MNKTFTLKTMIDYILDIDICTTKEFCQNIGLPEPYYTGQVKTSADQFLQIDAIKQKMFVEYAKFLNMKLTPGMFVPCNLDGVILTEPAPDSTDILAKSDYERAKSRVIFLEYTPEKIDRSRCWRLLWRDAGTCTITVNKFNTFEIRNYLGERVQLGSMKISELIYHHPFLKCQHIHHGMNEWKTEFKSRTNS